MVREVIERHLSRKELDTVNARGEQEKIRIGGILDRFLDELHDPEPISVCHNGGPANGEWIGEWLEWLEKPEPVVEFEAFDERPEPVVEFEAFDYDAAETRTLERMLRNDQLAAFYGLSV